MEPGLRILSASLLHGVDESSLANVVRRIPPKARPFINPLDGTNRRIQT